MALNFLRTHSAKAAVLGVAGLVLALLGLETYRALVSEYRVQVQSIQSSVERTAQQLAARTAGAMDQVNRSTLVVNYTLGRYPAPTLTDLELSGVIDTGLADPMFIADVKGFVQDSTSSAHMQYVADEEFFKQHLASSERQVFVGRVWTDVVSGAARIPVTRRLEVDGKFHGIVCAMVDPRVLTVPYGRHEVSSTTIGVLGDDGYYRSRLSEGRMTFGERLDPRAVAHQIAESKRTFLPGRSRVDGSERFAALVKVERYPLYAVVAVSAEAALAPYRQFREKNIRWAIVTTLGTVLAVLMLLRLARSLDESRRLTRTAEATFRAALEGSLDAVFILEAVRDPGEGRLVDLRIRDCNERAAQGLSTTRTELLGAMFSERLPASTERYLKAFNHVAATGKPAQNEMECHDPGLEGIWLHHQIVPLEDGFALISRDVTEKRANEATLAALSRADSLTSLTNRRGFEEKLEEAILRSARAKPGDGANLALLYVDLDGFKAINDSLGHAAGDAVLVEVARRLRAAVRTTDVVARLGGDEFAVIAENAGTRRDIDTLAERVLGDLSKPHRLGDAQRFATPSIGIAIHLPDEHSGAFRSRADAAMYRAKLAGKARAAWESTATFEGAASRTVD